MTERRKTYAPALIHRVTGSAIFSRNAVTLPCSSVGTQPYARASGTSTRCSVTSDSGTPMLLDLSAQVVSGKHITVQDDDRRIILAVQSLRSVSDRTTGAERFGLLNVGDLDA